MMDLREALATIQTHYNRIRDGYMTTAGRKYHADIIFKVMKEVPQTKDYWYYLPNEAMWANRFGKYDLPTPLAREVEIRKGVVYDPIINERNAPHEEGLYFIGEVLANPHTQVLQYWVKIGKANSAIDERLDTYGTYCPCCYTIDVRKGGTEQESMYHDLLRAYALGKHERSREWFMVDRETYLAMCNEGFEYFNKSHFRG